MTNLYSQLAHVYDEIYQTLFDYDKEYHTYQHFLKKYKAHSVVEIGCGTGHLAKRFIENGYDYMGLDLSAAMLSIAKGHTERACFREADMRCFQLEKQYDAVFITGRTISYLTTNQDVINCLESIYNCLKNSGILVFDAIDAVPLFSTFKAPKHDELVTTFEKNEYKRISKSTPNRTTGWTWDWHSVYYQKKQGEYAEIGNDTATLRAFTNEEIKLFLTICGFELLDIHKKETYSWHDAFFVAHKKQ